MKHKFLAFLSMIACARSPAFTRDKTLKTGSVAAFSRRTIFSSIFSKMQIGFRAFAEISEAPSARETTGSSRVTLPQQGESRSYCPSKVVSRNGRCKYPVC